jgi:hypothetical protein
VTIRRKRLSARDKGLVVFLLDRAAVVPPMKTIAIALAISVVAGAVPPAFAQAPAPTEAQQASSGGDPWPRKVTVQGATVSIYQPQLESWTGNLLDAYAAVTITTSGSAVKNYGVIWFTARTEVDKVNRIVSLADFALTKQNFPTLANNGAAYKSAFQGAMPWTQSMPLDELETALSTASVDSSQRRVAVDNTPPRIIVSSTPAVLVSIDGPPKLRPASGGFMKVLNTRALLLANASTNIYYLAVMDGWVTAPALDAPWTLAQTSATLDNIKATALASDQNQVLGNDKQSLQEAYDDGEAPKVYVSTTPAELILTRGAPTFDSIPGTNLSYVQNSAADIFQDAENGLTYVLLGGRWFSSPSLQGRPWTFVPGTGLPADFAKIPSYSPKADALVSVPGTVQAREAMIANQIPQTATISRTAAHLTVKYDGAPDFQPMSGTSLRYAANSRTPVIQMPAGSFYACQTGVWFVSSSAAGPWAVATSVPVEIYSIPASAPIHYVTYVSVYGYTPTSVYVGYTPGYYGTVLTPDGVVVYGTGYTYPPYIGSDLWVPTPYTYGVGAAFSWSADAGWALGFGLGAAVGALGPWWGPVGYWGWGAAAPAWGWGGYGGVASSNFYGHWGNAAYAGTRAAWANPYTGNIGAGERGRVYNPVTGTSGIGARGANFNAYSGNYAAGRAGAAYNPTTGVVKGGAHGVYGNAYSGEAGSVNRGFAYKPSTGNGLAYNGNNLYADHDGNIYRASPSSGWQQRSSDGWKGLSSSDLRSSLDSQAFSRGLGGRRWGNFNAGGWAGRFGGGGFADRGFGGFGGGFRGGGFGGFRGRR